MHSGCTREAIIRQLLGNQEAIRRQSGGNQEAIMRQSGGTQIREAIRGHSGGHPTLATIWSCSTPGMTRSRVASKQRSVGTPPRPETAPQLESRIEVRVCPLGSGASRWGSGGDREVIGRPSGGHQEATKEQPWHRMAIGWLPDHNRRALRKALRPGPRSIPRGWSSHPRRACCSRYDRRRRCGCSTATRYARTGGRANRPLGCPNCRGTVRERRQKQS